MRLPPEEPGVARRLTLTQLPSSHRRFPPPGERLVAGSTVAGIASRLCSD
jgi:hypothetical protein